MTAVVSPLVIEPGGAPPAAKRSPASANVKARGHGQRLLEAITALERFPALEYSRNRLLEVLDGKAVSAHDIVAAIESDPGLAMGALRLANQGRPSAARPICGIPDAVAEVAPADLRALVRNLPVFDFFGRGGSWSMAAQHFRVHAVATLRVAERLIGDGLAENPDQLRVGALVHDTGKLVVLHAYRRYLTGSEAPAQERLLVERRAWGLDHAVVGGVLARRVGLPNRVARLIERHHTDGEDGDTAVLRLANTLAHYSAGDPVSQTELIAIAESAGVAGARLDDLLYELPTAGAESRRVDPSPLTARQTSIVRLLAHGKLYKQIAAELELSPSTVRSHLHAVYTKLGVADRTQAVLLAMERGWLS